MGDSMKSLYLLTPLALCALAQTAFAKPMEYRGVCNQPGMMEFQVLDGQLETIVMRAKDTTPVTTTVCNKLSRPFKALVGDENQDQAAYTTDNLPMLEPNTCAAFHGFNFVVADARNPPTESNGYIQGCFRIDN